MTQPQSAQPDDLLSEQEQNLATEKVDSADATVESGVTQGDTDELKEQLRAQIENLEAEKQELINTLKRVQADFENFRKRIYKQAEELSEKAAVALMEKLLPIVDALDLAVQHHKASQEDTTGIQKVAQAFTELLEKEGLKKIGVVGEPFDPKKHEAIAKKEGSDEIFESPVVDEVHRYGYEYKGRVLRPAMVTVKG
jgi:molecular chaperone GrpE